MALHPEAIGSPPFEARSGMGRFHGSRSFQTPCANSWKLQAVHMSIVSWVSVHDRLLSNTYSTMRLSQGLEAPVVRRDAKLVTWKLRRRCASASSPWTMTGTQESKSTAFDSTAHSARTNTCRHRHSKAPHAWTKLLPNIRVC